MRITAGSHCERRQIFNKRNKEMKIIFTILSLVLLTLASCTQKNNEIKACDLPNFKSGYSEVNGIKMYYDIYGQGKPLVLIHGGCSTIQSNFERAIPLFAKNRLAIEGELQAHGRTSDRNTGLFFEQDADDIALHFSKT
jgi:hypothetical protein